MEIHFVPAGNTQSLEDLCVTHDLDLVIEASHAPYGNTRYLASICFIGEQGDEDSQFYAAEDSPSIVGSVIKLIQEINTAETVVVGGDILEIDAYVEDVAPPAVYALQARLEKESDDTPRRIPEQLDTPSTGDDLPF